MDLESVLGLFDSFWFNMEILKKQSKPTPSLKSQENPNNKVQENSEETDKDSSQSDDYLSYNSDSYSPDSVLPSTLFQTDTKKSEQKKMKVIRRREKRRTKSTKRGLSKSLSELEYEELKGFIDLGFKFSEDDENSNLIEIVPGLQKLDKNKDSDDKVKVKILEKCESRGRPYLSEAWEDPERNKRMNRLMNWKVPPMTISNETEIKHCLKWWAHTVASTVKTL